MILTRNKTEYNREMITGEDGKRFFVSDRHKSAIEYAISVIAASPISAKRIILYGSCARSDADYDSDIDIVITVAEHTNETARQIRKLRSMIWRDDLPEIDIHVLSEQEYEHPQTTYTKEVRKDGVMLWITE